MSCPDFSRRRSGFRRKADPWCDGDRNFPGWADFAADRAPRPAGPAHTPPQLQISKFLKIYFKYSIKTTVWNDYVHFSIMDWRRNKGKNREKTRGKNKRKKQGKNRGKNKRKKRGKIGPVSKMCRAEKQPRKIIFPTSSHPSPLPMVVFPLDRKTRPLHLDDIWNGRSFWWKILPAMKMGKLRRNLVEFNTWSLTLISPSVSWVKIHLLAHLCVCLRWLYCMKWLHDNVCVQYVSSFKKSTLRLRRLLSLRDTVFIFASGPKLIETPVECKFLVERVSPVRRGQLRLKRFPPLRSLPFWLVRKRNKKRIFDWSISTTQRWSV